MSGLFLQLLLLGRRKRRRTKQHKHNGVILHTGKKSPDAGNGRNTAVTGTQHTRIVKAHFKIILPTMDIIL